MKSIIKTIAILLAISFSSLIFAENDKEITESSKIQINDKVSHKKFGVGVVKAIKILENHTSLKIVFKIHGSKWLIAEYANLKVIGNK